MRAKAFGWTGVPVAVIGQGTWHMGDVARTRRAEVSALIAGLELGMTHIDTAEIYGNGGAEAVIAEALHGRRRADIFLASKVAPQHASYSGTIAAAEESLRRLQTDYLDLYLLHWPGRHPIGETMRAMEDLVAAGKIRFLGVSNFDVDDLRAGMQALTRERIACNQVLYNLDERGIESDLLPLCEREGIAIVGYTPFGDWPRARTVRNHALESVGARHGRTARQVALSYLTRTPALFAIPKASDPTHVRENAAAMDFELPAEDQATIESVFPAPRRKTPLATA